MPRRKTQIETEAPPPESPATETSPSEELPPSDVNGAAPEPAPTQSNGNGDKHRPLISWRVSSDRTTTLELAVWSNTVRTQAGEQYEQLSCTITRSYRDKEGTWQKGGSYRVHDLPVLAYLLTKAHTFALDKREQSVPF